MKNIITLTIVFCTFAAGAVLFFSTPGGFPAGKIQERADPSLPMATNSAQAKSNVTVLTKTNYPMPSEISEALAKTWVDNARRKRENSEIADIVKNQTVEECTLPGRVRMEDGLCWRPETWRKLHN